MELIEFIIEAKLSGYAASGEAGELIFNDGSLGFEYQSGVFRYRDRYYGFNPFSGSEIVFEKDVPVWIMNYYGQCSLSTEQTKQVYSYLKKVMKLISNEYPFRGPVLHQDGNYEYSNHQEGDIRSFQGKETIRLNGKEIYQLWYHGGCLRHSIE